MRYLKDDQYYEDLYDLVTIKRCLEIEDSAYKSYMNKKGSLSSSSAEDYRKVTDLVAEFRKGYYLAERYQKKSEKIEDWKRKDTQLQNLYDNSKYPPINSCYACESTQVIPTLKDIDNSADGRSEITFWYECSSCKLKQHYDKQGRFIPRQKFYCQKCYAELKKTHSRSGDVITTYITCIGCDFKDTEKLDLAGDESEFKRSEQRDRELLSKYRSKFTLSEEDVLDFINSMDTIDELKKLNAKSENGKYDPVIKKLKQIRSLKTSEIKEFLQKALDDSGYTNLTFLPSKVDKYITIEFSVEDTNEHSEYNSKRKLKKLIQNTLKLTNWRLMSDGLTYRLGCLSGSIKGYSTEEDLYKLAEKLV